MINENIWGRFYFSVTCKQSENGQDKPYIQDKLIVETNSKLNLRWTLSTQTITAATGATF